MPRTAAAPFLATLAVVLSLGLSVQARAACEAATRLAYNAPATLVGTIAQGKGRHDVQGEFTYTYVKLDRPVCVDAGGDDEFSVATEEPIDRIQLAGDAITKDLPAGGRVRVEGTLFGAHTMWHVEDVLIDATTVTPQ